jgi:hypothetical protein
VSLPRGLTFKKSKRPGKGISVSGPHTVKLSGGRLIITLKPAAVSVSVRIASAALVESKQLKKQVQMHKDNPTKQLRLLVTDADGAKSTLTP